MDQASRSLSGGFWPTIIPLAGRAKTHQPGAIPVTAEEKAVLIKGASELLLDILKKPLDATLGTVRE